VPRARALTRSAVYRIVTADGPVRRRLDQAGARGRWTRLGTFALATGVEVRLSDRTGERPILGRRVAYDAVRFVPLWVTPGASTRPATRPAKPLAPPPDRPAPDRAQPTPPPEAPLPARRVDKPGPTPAPGPGPSPSPSPGPDDAGTDALADLPAHDDT
jgi:hypothetical protein